MTKSGREEQRRRLDSREKTALMSSPYGVKVVNNVLFLVAAQAVGAVSFEVVWKRKIEVELTKSFFFKAVLPRMIAQSWSRVINFTGLMSRDAMQKDGYDVTTDTRCV